MPGNEGTKLIIYNLDDNSVNYPLFYHALSVIIEVN